MTVADRRFRGAWAVLTGKAKAVPPMSFNLAELGERVALDKVDALREALEVARADIAMVAGQGDESKRLAWAQDAMHDIDFQLGLRREPARGVGRG